MRQLFPENFLPDEAYFDGLWANALIVFDTNVLMHIHSLHKDSAKWFLDECEKKLGQKLWLPNQVAREFTKNRTKRLSQRIKTIDENINLINKQVTQLKSSLISQLGNAGTQVDEESFPNISNALQTWLEPYIARLNAEVDDLKQRHKLDEDIFFEHIERIYEGRIGEAYSLSQEEDIYKKGEERYKGEIPPGFGDTKKSEYYRLYGDYILWKQILDKAAQSTVSGIILVTDDNKKMDWFEKEKQPHKELVREFNKSIPGKSFWLYSYRDFLYEAQKRGFILGEKEYRDLLAEAERRDQQERHKELAQQQYNETLKRIRDITLLDGRYLPSIQVQDLDKPLASYTVKPTLTGEAFRRALQTLQALHASRQLDKNWSSVSEWDDREGPNYELADLDEDWQEDEGSQDVSNDGSRNVDQND